MKNKKVSQEHRVLIIFPLILITSSLNAMLLFIEPDSFASGTDISNAFEYVTLKATGSYEGLEPQVYSLAATNPDLASTKSNVFGNNLEGFDLAGNPIAEIWIQPHVLLKAQFHIPANWISIDIIGNDLTDIGILTAYDSTGTMLGKATSPSLEFGQAYSLEFRAPLFEIDYILVTGLSPNSVHLDNLQANVIPEPATILLFGLAIVMLRKK